MIAMMSGTNPSWPLMVAIGIPKTDKRASDVKVGKEECVKKPAARARHAQPALLMRRVQVKRRVRVNGIVVGHVSDAAGKCC